MAFRTNRVLLLLSGLVLGFLAFRWLGDSPSEAEPTSAPSISRASDEGDRAALRPNPPPALPWVGAAEPFADDARESTAPSTLGSPLALLPPDTLAVGFVPVWSDAMEEIGAWRLLQRFEVDLADGDEELAALGLAWPDLVDPSALGLDAHGMVAVAWLQADAPVAVFGASIADPVAFEAALSTALELVGEKYPGRFITEAQGDATVTIEAGDTPSVAIVRRSGLAYLVTSDAWRGSVLTAVAQIAWQAPDEALPETPAWKQSMQWVDGELAFGFLNLPALRLQWDFALQTDLEEIEAMEPSDEGWAVYRRRQNALGRSALNTILGGLGGVAAAVTSSSGRLVADARLVMQRGSLIERLVRNRHAQSGLQRAMPPTLGFVLDGATHPEVLKELMRTLATASGQDFEQWMTVAEGVLLDDPFRLWTGEFGLAVQPPERRGEMPVFSAFLGVTDPDAVHGILSRLAIFGSFGAGIFRSEEADAWCFETPGGPMPCVGLAGSNLVATTDLGVLDRLRGLGGAGGSNAPDWPELAALVQADGEAGAVAWQFSTFAAPEPRDEEADERDDEIETLAEEVEPEEALEDGMQEAWEDEGQFVHFATPAPPPAETPPAESEREREYREVTDSISEAYSRHSIQSQRIESARLSELGALAVTARNDGNTLRLRGVWQRKATSLEAWIEALATHSQAMSRLDDALQRTVQPLYERQTELSPPAEPTHEYAAPETPP